MTSAEWLAELRLAARGAARQGTQVLRGASPPLGNASSAAALSSLALAAFVIAAALFRARVAPLSFDLIASLLRVLALASALRAALGLARVVAQLREDRTAAGALLALSDQGLLLQIGGREQWARRDEILEVTFPEALPSRALAPRAPALLVVLTPAAGQPRWLAIPPFFAPSTEILQARLARWLSAPPRPAPRAPDPPPPEPELRYARAARGELPAGAVVIPEGRAYLLRAPYAALLALAFALDILCSAGPARAQLAGPLLAASLLTLLVLAAWFIWLSRRRATRLGIGMLLAPEELLVRGAGGVVSVPWAQLSELSVQTTARWSPFVGSYAARTLLLSTQEGQRMLFDGSFLGVPVEVAAALCRAYRAGQLAHATTTLAARADALA
jgi:hypothetical protein